MTTSEPELIFALTGAIGTDLDLVLTELEKQLKNVGYTAQLVKLTDALRLKPFDDWVKLPPRTAPDYYEKAMDAGNHVRSKLKSPDALAALAIAVIQEMRSELAGTTASVKRAYIISSLKRPEEVKLLRKVYGAAFFVISAYAPRAVRVDRLAAQLAERSHENRAEPRRDSAETLILRDESESADPDLGQDIRKTFPLGDLFVNTSSVVDCQKEIGRFISLIFGHPWLTPTRDEQGMSFAFLAALRSASPARQVGAALTDSQGNIQSVGTNDVASPFGGQYWEGDDGDGRDYLYDRVDKSDIMRTNLLTDVLGRLRRLDVLKEAGTSDENLLKSGSKSQILLRKSQLFDTIDFVRSVHAEAAALFAAKGRTERCTLYVTTFPCHECARHIVFAGIERVVYVEPYPKSLVGELYKDSISVDSEEKSQKKVSFVPFTGISPTVYQHLFSLWNKKRKQNDGTLFQWSASKAVPRLDASYSSEAIETAETEVLGWLYKVLKERVTANDRSAKNVKKRVVRKPAHRSAKRS